MAEASITNTLDTLEVLFNQMKEVFLIKTPNQALSAITAFDMELPVLDDGVTFDTGSADITKVKLTTGRIWTAVAAPGDADIQFQIASVAGVINETFMEKKVATASMTATIGGDTYEGEGYDFSPKKVKGALFMRSEDHQTALYLPNVEGYSNFVSEKGKPAYHNTSWTPKNDSNGAGIYILRKKVTTGA